MEREFPKLGYIVIFACWFSSVPFLYSFSSSPTLPTEFAAIAATEVTMMIWTAKMQGQYIALSRASVTDISARRVRQLGLLDEILHQDKRWRFRYLNFASVLGLCLLLDIAIIASPWFSIQSSPFKAAALVHVLQGFGGLIGT